MASKHEGIKPFDPDYRQRQSEVMSHIRVKLAENAQHTLRAQRRFDTVTEELAAVHRGIPLPKFRQQKMLAGADAENLYLRPLPDDFEPNAHDSVTVETVYPSADNFPRPFSNDESRLADVVYNSRWGLITRSKEKERLASSLHREDLKLQHWICEAKARRQSKKSKMRKKGARWTPEEEKKLKKNEQLWGALGFDMYPEVWQKGPEHGLMGMSAIAAGIREIGPRRKRRK